MPHSNATNAGAVGASDFKHGLRRLAAGVSIVTSTLGGRYCGMTANSVISVCLEPPLVLVSLHAESETATGVDETGAFGISVLSAEHRELARRFATNRLGARKFEGWTFTAGTTGVPLLEAAHASFEATLHERHAVGDHVLFLGRVVDVSGAETTRPLLYHKGDYAGLDTSADLQASAHG